VWCPRDEAMIAMTRMIMEYIMSMSQIRKENASIASIWFGRDN